MTISAIGETQEQRKLRWDNATDFEREKHTRAMKEWALKYPFAFEMMFGDMTYEEKVRYAEERFNGMF